MSELTPRQKELFDALHEERLQAYKFFSKRDYGRLFTSLVDKYPETAHFIYELLQNAEDANASYVRFVLKRDRLFFSHNGTKHFDVTPVDSEAIGDLNSITGIGFSSKVFDLSSEQEIGAQSIGKFGVGFKSVFQYTDSPEIYDDTYCFKIENYIIPTLLDHDEPTRNSGETLFVFRFKEQIRNQAYNHILQRLQNLRNPLLFLNNIKKIVWSNESFGGKKTELCYEKHLIEKELYGDILLERYHLIEPNDTHSVFLFSRKKKVQDKGIFPIYIGFYYNEENNRLITHLKRNVYCYFPTKISFNTCFFAHAPFLLTDNRQDLKPDVGVNIDLINALADLAARSVVILRDYGIKHNNLLINENITDICPQYNNRYDDDENIYETPFRKSFMEVLYEEPLLLSRNGKYLTPSNSYHTHIGVFELVNQKQFNLLRSKFYGYTCEGMDFLQWELSQSIQHLDDDCSYFEDVSRYSIADFGRDISESFMDSMEFDWVIKFYNFLRQHASQHINITYQTKGTELVFRRAPIVKTQNNRWVSPFINNTTLNVFFPISKKNDAISGYNFINDDYVNNEYARKFFEQLDVKTPDKLDYIRNIVLNKYQEENSTIDDDVIRSDYFILLDYYQQVRQKEDEDAFIQLVKENLLLYGTDDSLTKPSEMYLESPLLKRYFDGNNDIVFFNFNYYWDWQKTDFKASLLTDFVCQIGVRTKPRVLMESYDTQWNAPIYIQEKLENLYYNDFYYINNPRLQGFDYACKHGNITKEVSVFLWNEIICSHIDQQNAIIRIRKKRARSSSFDNCISSFLYELLNNKWIYDKDGKLCSPADLFIENLAPEYDLDNGVCGMLGLAKAMPNLKEKYGVTEEEQQQFEDGAEFQKLFKGMSSEQRAYAIRLIEQVKNQDKSSPVNMGDDELARPEPPQKRDQKKKQVSIQAIEQNVEQDESAEDRLNRKLEEKKHRSIGKPHSKMNDGMLLHIENSLADSSSNHNNDPFFVEPDGSANEVHYGMNDFARAEKNLKSKNEKAQEQVETSKEQVDYLNLLSQAEKFSFRWFKILMMLMHGDGGKTAGRRAQIDFTGHELTNSEKILNLTGPSMPVPAWICDAEQYSIEALFDKTSVKLDGLIVRVEDRCIDLSVELSEQIKVDMLNTKKIRLIATDNTNILDSLETRFLQLDKEDSFDMNANLPENISFIYGPPGTGKTTELVRQVHELSKQNPDAKILVLTPTNKAADVVAVKMANDDVCETSLARYGATECLYLIEEIGCLTNRETTNMEWHNIVVATAARYAYDYVQPNDTPICDYPWDYIFIDEASMVDIITMVYILYKGAGAKKIVISGDPKQIRPVVANDMPDYNIYDMVGLDGFYEAIFNYERFEVKGLTIQHRSIPVIGDLVSKFTYDGLVKADPNRAEMKPLILDGLIISNINFVGFDVAELDEIRGLNSINDSAFNLYSVIFTYNMVEYTIKQIEKHYPMKEYSIGVVCAYRAQADAIKNMLENRPLETAYCKVVCGTVHSFQGDECDIMFVVLNPPAICTSGTHVNNRNIVNVAMSRARDYLFFVVPNGQQKGFSMKNTIGNLIPLPDRALLKCRDVERVMFDGNDNYIYENTHVTCHMPVNVYCEDNALYEVRMSDDALDIRING